jgi:iron complex outermembrane receptor protein
MKVLLSFILMSSPLMQGMPMQTSAPAAPVVTLPIDTARVDTGVTLRDVTVMGNKKKNFQMKTSVNSVLVDRDFLTSHFGGSLMQSLQSIPGVKAMAIGSGQSKPTIRGLGFNRMVVAEDGVKHEGQQWGDDHGLEIDQYAIDHIEVIKGPAALLYGSDAIGGVINLYTNHIPTKPFQGNVSLFSRTNNASLGMSARMEGMQGKFFWRTNLTAIDYADYKVPADSFEYYSYNIPLYKHHLRNTAGHELDGNVTLGYMGYRVHTSLQISDAYTKSGFFANAHGLEVRLSDIDYDHSSRDVDLPYQSVNHLKIGSHTIYQADRFSLEARLSYQHNLRREYSEPTSHGYMPKPDGTLERGFSKHTLTGIVELNMPIAQQHQLKAGISSEYQHNRRSGWGFVMPDFEAITFGAYAIDRYTLTPNLIVNAGLRYDIGRTKIHSYHDWFKTPVSNTDSVYKERSTNFSRTLASMTWSAGINYSIGEWILKANVGKSFRMPIPKELGADGVNYHIFRYEQGNTSLKPEESYQIDAGINWSNKVLTLQFDPYINYFSNYIYMNPTPDYVEGLQLYQYTQARVLRYGFEIQADYKLTPWLEATAKGAYLYARQKSGKKKGYGLPFATPWSIDTDLRYLFDREEGREGFVAVNCHIVGRQNDIVPPESPTPGYYTLNFSAGKMFMVSGHDLHISLNGENLLNRRYFDHTNYYRLMGIPEPGRNFAIMVDYHF